MRSDKNQPNSRVGKKKNHKKRQAAGSVNWLRYLLFLGGVATLSSSLGMVSAFLLAATPLKKSPSDLSQNTDSLSSIIPATLSRPINILVLGIDNSGHPHAGNFTPAEALAGNSDTMLLVRLIPQTHQINILSIPRDTLVHIPGYGVGNTYGFDKINDANLRGGAKIAVKTVSQLLSDIPIDHYVRLDTEGFIHLADTLGGVEINIPKAMDYEDHTQDLYIHFSPGRQKLNGQHLQEYVRFRHDELGDIGRVERQQEVMKAIVRTFVQPSTLTKLPSLLQVIKNNIDTDFSVGEMLAISQFLFQVDRQHMDVVMLPGRFSEPSEYKLSYWISDLAATAPILAQYFDFHINERSNFADATFNPTKIRLAVANGTIQAGQARKIARFLLNHGFENTYVVFHQLNYNNLPISQTQIIAQKGNLQAANAVKTVLGLGEVQVLSTGDIESDVTVVVGNDLVTKLISYR